MVTCPHYQDCGGCDFRDRPYDEQLTYKQRYTHNLLAPFSPALEPIVASPAQDYYRNKMEFVVARSSQGEVRIGQRRKNCFNAIVDISDCPIFHIRAGGICALVKEWVAANGTPVYDLEKGGRGLRYITLRHSKAGDEMMVTITSAGVLPQVEDLAGQFVRNGVAASVYTCVNDAASDRAVAGQLRCVAGNEFIRETVNGVSYRIYPRTFFQTNPACCAGLYAQVLRFLGNTHGGRGDRSEVIDLFCGSGGISLQLAAAGYPVTGIDNVSENCRCAEVNAADNRLGNVQFVCADAHEHLQGMRSSAAMTRVQALVIDPPRQGLGKRFCAILAESGIPQIIYVSCNPLTLAQDLKVLSTAYRVQACVPVDMFPHTRHIETVVNLRDTSNRVENRPWY